MRDPLDHLERALQQVRAQKALKTRARDRLNVEIAQLDATEIGIQNALGQQIQAEIAWTDLVRTVLNQVPGAWMSAVEVRDTILSWGYNFAGIANPLAFINNILNRLAVQQEILRSDAGRPFRFSCE